MPTQGEAVLGPPPHPCEARAPELPQGQQKVERGFQLWRTDPLREAQGPAVESRIELDTKNWLTEEGGFPGSSAG